MIYHAMIIMHINQDIKYANVSLFYVPKDGEKKGKIFCHISQIAYSGKSPSFLGWKERKKR